jgi:hypothetical protein
MKIKAIFPASLLFISILLLISSSVAAQVGEKEKKEKEAERQQQLEHKSYVLVEEIASGALSLKLPENRSFVLAATADLMWEHDEPRARNLFWDALNTLNLMNNLAGNKANNRASQKGEEGTNSAKPSAKERERALSEYFAVYALRQELLRRVARRDPTLALDMLRSSRQLPVEPIYASFPIPDDRELEQQIASEAAARDPERALQLARESLAKGLSFQLLDLLFRLNQKSEEAGKKFAGDIIDKLRARNLALDPYGARIAVSLLQFSRPPKEAPGEKMQLNRMRQLKLEQEQRRELVDLITNAALTGSANPNLLFALEDVMPEVEDLVPERVALLRRKLTSFNQTLNKEQKVSQEYNSIFHSGTPEEMIKLAVRAGDDDREWMQQQAIVMAVMRGRADSLRDFVNTEIEDQSRRKGLLDALDAEQINLAVSKGDAEGLRKLLPKIRLKEERARAMAEIALVLEKKGNHDEALKLLDEAQTLIKTDLNSETQTNALLAVVTAYALVEPAKAFGIIERTIDSANDQIAKLLLLDKIVKSGAIKKGEIRLQQSGMMPIDFAVFKYGKSVAALANVDFDRTKAAADRFERNELRLMVRLLLAQALLPRDDRQLKEAEQ